MSKKPIIAFMLSNKQDEIFVEDFIKKAGYQAEKMKDCNGLTQDIDLIVLDGVCFSKFEIALRKWKEKTPYFIPILLLTTNEYLNFITDNLFVIIDQILFLPVEKIELDATIKVLLRAHNYAILLWEKNRQLLNFMENIFNLLYEYFQISSFRWDVKNNLFYFSKNFFNIFPEGINSVEDFKSFFHIEDWPLVEYTIDEILSSSSKNFADIQVRITNKEGYQHVNLRFYLERDEENKPLYLDAILLDIEKIFSQNEELRIALEQQKNLLRELFHRTRNNMQTIISFLSLYSNKYKECKDIFKDIELKIRALAHLQDMLYKGNSMISCDLGEYLKKIISSSEQVYSNIKWKIYIENETILSAKKAEALGLVVVELIQNSVKHAFQKIEREPEISLSVKRIEKEILVEYEDNGKWNINNENNKNKLGAHIIKELVTKTLYGEIENKSTTHCKILIHFPID